jgi:hypothetical protein
LQAYQEIKEDQHPIVIISAADIVTVLKAAGINSEQGLATWLKVLTLGACSKPHEQRLPKVSGKRQLWALGSTDAP